MAGTVAEVMRSTVFIVLGVIAAVIIAIVGVIAAVGFAVFRGLDSMGGVERQRLSPVPVDPGACPALAFVRETAADAEATWSHALTTNQDWPEFANRLGPELQALADSLRAATPLVPAPVATELARVTTEVEAGQRDLFFATNLPDYVTATTSKLFRGEAALADASDLVGSACGAPIHERAPELSRFG